jgi:hypothetical protein
MNKTLVLLISCWSVALAFTPRPHSHSHPHQRVVVRTQQLYSETAETSETATTEKPIVKQLGLLTFDLDDTLYPILTVVEEANGE